MNRDQMINFLLHPAINISWFARKFYEGQKGAVVQKFYNKLHGRDKQHFDSLEILRLKKVITEFANTDLDERIKR